MTTHDTIYALSSGPPPSGLAVIRLSGPQASAALSALSGPTPKPRHATLRDLRSLRTGDPLDKGLVLWFPGPASFTGEDSAELHVHGGRAVIAALLSELSGLPGLRMAEPGEFARRAFENGRLDLTEAEGLADLIAAETEHQRRQAVDQAGGRLRRSFEAWRTDLIAAQAQVEAGIDFTDEADVPAEVMARARPVVERLHAEVGTALAAGRSGEIIRDGYRVVLAGPPNVGKSSLLNALAKRDVAIVSPEPGTTRDAIEVRLDLQGLAVLVTDTAGLHSSENAIEQEGMRRTLLHASDADLVIWLVDPLDPQKDPAPGLVGRPGLRVVTKSDLSCRPVPGLGPGTLRVSARTGHGMTAFVSEIRSRADGVLLQSETALVTRQRHRLLLEAAQEGTATFLAGDPHALELRAEDLRRAAQALGRLTGAIDAEEVLGAIFGTFCIGK